MSDNRDPSYYEFCLSNHDGGAPGFGFSINSSLYPQNSGNHESHQMNCSSHGFDPTSHMSFTNCLHESTDYGALARAFDLSCSSPEVLVAQDRKGNEMFESSGHGGNSGTPNLSTSSPSTDAAAEDDLGRTEKDEQIKGFQDGAERSKKVTKPRKKRERERRFAFMTKSEVDNLEDGYRWRKYGQKTVKNSTYPRSYYRCTSQKCSVKKRVERSFQDPTIVITTYEGVHSHQSPATIRGSATAMFSPSFLTHQNLLMQLPPPNLRADTSSIYMQNPTPNQRIQFPDYGLLQDIVPPFIHKP